MHETPSLKALAFKALERLERNTTRNKDETNGSQSVSQPVSGETRNAPLSKPLHFDPSSLTDDYEERLAICEYNGHQTSSQAKRIAYLDSFMSVLGTLPYDAAGRFEKDWLEQRIKSAQDWLVAQGLEQPK